MDRSKIIVRTSILGIATNAFLAAFKMFVGVLSGSIAIITDSVNNLSDALSSVITIIGVKIAGKRPDKAHPFGLGRVEYISASVISLIVIYAGVTAFIESVKAIIDPTEPDYKAITLIIVSIAIVVKVLIGLYFVKVGKKVESNALVASGKEAMFDSLVSLSTLMAAIVFIFLHVSLEAYLAAVIAIVMTRSGILMLKETISQILGERISTDTAKEIKSIINSFDEVHGVYDLVLHNYGPDYYVGSVHIEVDDDMTVRKLDELERNIVDKVYAEKAVILAGISVYGKNTSNDFVAKVQNDIRKRVMSKEHVLQMHGFYLNETDKKIQFDVVIDYAAPNMHKLYEEICAELNEAYPDFNVVVALDLDMSD